MGSRTRNLAVVTVFLLAQFSAVFPDPDRPCKKVYLKANRSPVCVCDSDYCDDILRQIPTAGTYITYTSSESGQRFRKRVAKLQNFYYPRQDNVCPARMCTPAFLLDSRTQYQTIEGFGGAVTDAASMNWDRLETEELKQYLIDSYFSENGLNYNMMRVPIGGSDFSTHPYAYNELPVGDTKLTNFSLSSEDYDFKLPMIKRGFEAATDDVHIVATVWSPPAWMKTNDALYGSPAQLRKEYYQTYADYHLKFLEEYEKQGVPVWAITTTNEPSNGIITDEITFNSLGWQTHDQGRWIANNLGPTIRNSSFKDIKILCNDDQRHDLVAYYTSMLSSVPEAIKYIDGAAVHFYLDKLVPPEQLTYANQAFPDKFIISTEACAGVLSNVPVDLGAWDRAQLYLTDIIENMNHNVTGWIDWNLCLDEQGGPNWDSNFVDSPVIVPADGKKFYKQPMYYAMGHVSKFVPRGSRRIQVTPLCQKTVENVAFLTPENTIVTVLHNTGEATVVNLVTCNRRAEVAMVKNSIATVEFNREDCRPASPVWPVPY